MDSDVSKMFQDHNHDGNGSNRINASNIEFNSSSCKNIKATRVSEALKILDNLINNYQEKLKGKPGNIVIYDKEGNVSEIPSNTYSSSNHIHSDYVKIGNIINGKLPIFKDNKIEDSKLDINEILTKSEGNVINKSLLLLSETFEKYKNHNHDKDYLKKISGNSNLFVIDETGNLVDSGISTKDVILKKDINLIVNQIVESELEKLKILIKNNFSSINHDHIEFEENKNYVKKDEFKNLIKSVLKEIINES